MPARGLQGLVADVEVCSLVTVLRFDAEPAMLLAQRVHGAGVRAGQHRHADQEAAVFGNRPVAAEAEQFGAVGSGVLVNGRDNFRVNSIGDIHGSLISF